MADPKYTQITIHPNYDIQITYKWLGLGIVIAAAIISNLGVNIQKLSHLKENSLPETEQSKYYIRPLWILGMLLVILGSIGDFEALGFAPQALVASVGGSCTVLANVCFAHLWLKQPLSKSDIIGTLLIIVGAVLSAIVNRPDEQLTLDRLEQLFIRPRFLFYMVVMGITIGTLFMEIHRIVMLEKRTSTTYNILPYLYAVVSGIIGSFSVLLAKCASVLLFLTFGGNNQFRHGTSYLFVGGMFFTLILQTDLLNRAIMSGDTLSVFPVFQCSWICCSVIGGIVFYERAGFTIEEWIFLPLALLFIIVGIYFLSQHTQHDIIERQRILDKEPKKSRKNTYFTNVAPLSPQMSQMNDDRNAFDDSSYGTTNKKDMS